MALIKCKECGEEVSTKASRCPKCGAKRGRSLSVIEVIGGLIVGVAVIAYMAAGGTQGEVQRNMVQIQDQVAVDAVNQYQIAKRQGDPIQVCVQAMGVAAAYLQAKNELSYKQWKGTEKADCARAGMPAT